MNNLPKWRFLFVVFSLLAMALVIVIQYARMMQKNDSDMTRASQPVQERGTIVDRNGKILATQVRHYDIYVKPPKNRDDESIAALAHELSPILDMREEEIRGKIFEAKKDIIIKRHVTRDIWDKITEEQKNGKLSGVTARDVPFRFYPENDLAAQIIGFVGNEYQGLEGIENACNLELSGSETGGRGSKVVLTIDANVQHILEKISRTTMEETRAETVMFLAMDPRSGEILGSAVLPGFDPNDYLASGSERYPNLTAIENYEPGSVFKAFSISALMDAGVISEDSVFICNGYYETTFRNGETVRIECADGTAHGRVGPREIIIHSCNVGASYAAERLDNQSFYQMMSNYGFGKKTGAWVNGETINMETAGLLMDPGLWSGRTRQSIAFGQEIAVSALQIIQAASIIANDGVMVPPKIVSQIVSADGKIISNGENPGNVNRRVIKPETARKMLSYMADAATEIGTGWRASVEDLHLAVKTGTSQYRDPLSRGYSKTDFVASCVALLPAESPSLILYVVIIKPRGETYGGRIAAPAIREAAELLIDYLGIPRGRNPIVGHSGQINISGETLPVLGSQVPNYIGLSKRTLLPLLLLKDTRVEIRGEGWVRRQSPPPGTPLSPDTIIELTLE